MRKDTKIGIKNPSKMQTEMEFDDEFDVDDEELEMADLELEDELDTRSHSRKMEDVRMEDKENDFRTLSLRGDSRGREVKMEMEEDEEGEFDELLLSFS